MLQLLEGNCTELEAFAVSATDLVLLLLRERKDVALRHENQENIVRRTVLLHLLRTLDGMCSSESVREWQIESVLKLRFALWVSFKTELFETNNDDNENIGRLHSQMLEDSKEEESRLARDLFSIQAGGVYMQRVSILTWCVVEILLPFCCCWGGRELWRCAESFCDHPFVLWVVRTLKDADIAPESEWQISLLKQRVVEMTVMLGADAVVVVTDSELFTNAYLYTLVGTKNMSSPELFMELTSSLRDGVIRGDRLYYNDLSVLLETLRHHLSLNTEDVHKHKLQTAIDILLNTACPISEDQGQICGVEAVCQWFDLLNLQHDYRHVLIDGAIDAKVLRSGLASHNVREMGIHSEVDAKILLRVLCAQPQQKKGV